MPRAGRPVKRLVSAVCCAASLASARGAAGWWSPRGRAGRPCRPARRRRRAPAPRRRPGVGDAAGGDDRHRDRPRPAARSASVPTCVVRSSVRNMPRWPPASSALRDDGVDAVRLEPARLVDGRRRRDDLGAPALHRARAARLAAGRNGSSRPPAGSRRATSSGRVVERAPRRGARGNRVGVEPELVVVGRSARRQAVSRAASGAGGGGRRSSRSPAGRSRARMAASSPRIASGVSSAHGSEPRPPAFDTAMASARR